jgi:hypothetical protein
MRLECERECAGKYLRPCDRLREDERKERIEETVREREDGERRYRWGRWLLEELPG